MSEKANVASGKYNVGWVGLGDQGAPIARAIAEAGYPLQVWARRASALDVLEGVPYTAHPSAASMAQASDVVGLCLSEDKDNFQVLTEGGVLAALNPGSIVVNHGTGLPAVAEQMTRVAAERQIAVLDAPVSGGHAGAVAKQLTTIVGGDPIAAAKVRPLFESFSALVAYMGPAGAGQTGKLINNALLMANQKNIADLLDVAQQLRVDIPALVRVLRSGTGSSTALQVLGSAIRPDNAEHLKKLQLIDMDIFVEATADLSNMASINQHAIAGAQALPTLARTVTT